MYESESSSNLNEVLMVSKGKAQRHEWVKRHIDKSISIYELLSLVPKKVGVFPMHPRVQWIASFSPKRKYPENDPRDGNTTSL